MYVDAEDIWALIKPALFVALCAFGIHSCVTSDWYKASEAAKAAQEHADATPHVIREADGCKVYAFKSGDAWHYFTRCGNGEVTTDRSYDERHGKTTVHKTESITTEGNS